jgi:hypothetical protein
MIIRDFKPADRESLKEILAKSRFQYAFPDTEDWRFNPAIVVEDDAGRIAMGAGLRMTSEAYLWADHEVGTPRERWQWLLGLHEAVRREAKHIGYRDVHAFLPPGMPKGFSRRLRGLGWVPETFEPWWRSTS